MNGRLYDPLIGRMLSPDNFVEDATSTQDYNRYSYVRNNPLKYTDPSGWNKDNWDFGNEMPTFEDVNQEGGGGAPYNPLGYSYEIMSNEINTWIVNVSSSWTHMPSWQYTNYSQTSVSTYNYSYNTSPFQTPMTSRGSNFSVSSNYGSFGGYYAGGGGIDMNNATASLGSYLLGDGNNTNPNKNNHSKSIQTQILELYNNSKVGDKLPKSQAVVIFPMLPQVAVLGISQVLRVNGGIQIDLNWVGNKAVKGQGLVFEDNSIIYVNPIKDMVNIYSPGNKIYFGQDLVDFNIYISGNSWSIYKDFHKSFKF